MARNVADKRQSKALLAIQRRHAAQDAEDLRAVLSTASGRNVLWRILSQCGIFHHIVTTEDKLLHTGAAIGKQNFGKDLFQDILLSDPKSYILMQDEDRRRADEIAQVEKKESEDVGAE